MPKKDGEHLNLAAEIKEIKARLDAMDKAADILHQDFVRVPTEMDRQIKHLHDLLKSDIAANKEAVTTLYQQWIARQAVLDERFLVRDEWAKQATALGKEYLDGIFAERDKRAEALMRVQLESLTKMENNFIKLIEQGAATNAASNRGLTDSLNDVKSRMDRGEGKTSVTDPSVAEAIRMMNATVSSLQNTSRESAGHSKGIGDSWGFLVGAAGMFAAIATIAHYALR